MVAHAYDQNSQPGKAIVTVDYEGCEWKNQPNAVADEHERCPDQSVSGNSSNRQLCCPRSGCCAKTTKFQSTSMKRDTT